MLDRLRAKSERDEGWWILPAGLTVIAGIGITALCGGFDSSEPPRVDRSRAVVVVEAIDGGDHIVPPNLVVDDLDVLNVEQDGVVERVVVSEEEFLQIQQKLEAAEEAGTTVTTILEPNR